MMAKFNNEAIKTSSNKAVSNNPAIRIESRMSDFTGSRPQTRPLGHKQNIFVPNFNIDMQLKKKRQTNVLIGAAALSSSFQLPEVWTNVPPITSAHTSMVGFQNARLKLES